MVLNAFKKGILLSEPIKGTLEPTTGMSARTANVSDRSTLKMLTPEQMLQRLP